MGAADILKDAGFQVMDADHGDTAFALMQQRHREVVLLFTDVQIPGTLDGFALARAVAVCGPHVAIVVPSGHANPGPGSMPDKARFIGKPFNANMVHAHLHEILPDGQKPAPVRATEAGK